MTCIVFGVSNEKTVVNALIEPKQREYRRLLNIINAAAFHMRAPALLNIKSILITDLSLLNLFFKYNNNNERRSVTIKITKSLKIKK